MLSKGCLYRWGQRIKDFGERMACYPVVRLFSGPLIHLGYAIKNGVLNRTVDGL